MALNKYKLGDLIQMSDERNTKGVYGIDDVKGMTIEKTIIPTKADMNGADVSKFIVVHPNEFIYNQRTHGKKIGLGFNDTSVSFLISWNNIAFGIKESAKNIISPKYLYMNFNRPEWDRKACRDSWGTSTEVFSWDSMCDMSITLPDLKTQQKFVRIYEAMSENLNAYQKGIDDLKTVCDAYLDKLKKECDKVRIGELFTEIDRRNNNSKYSTVKGINIDKQFIDSVADINGVDLSKYKVIYKNELAYSGMQTGRDGCIRIALQYSDEPYLISPAYSIFQVDEQRALPEYIMMWFSRSEIDRLGSFYSDASIRANLDNDRLFDVQIPIPDIEIQHTIADIYRVYTERKRIGEQLKSQLKDLCPVLIKGSLK